MEGHLDKTVRHPIMKLLVDFDNLGYDRKDEWTDITDDVIEITGSKEKSGNDIGSVTSDIATFSVDNTTKRFNNDNNKSPLYGKIKSNLKFRLLTGFQGETLVPYASGYIESFTPAWRDKRISIKTTDYFKLFKEEKPPETGFQDISWDALVNILCDTAGLPSFIVRNIPKTEFYYTYFKFEEDNCFEALKSLMAVAVGEAYFEQERFYVKTKLALDYQLDTTVDHDITVDHLFDFEENVDNGNIINSVEIKSEYKTIAPIEVVFKTPENIIKVENELITYDGSGSIYVDPNNLPIIHKEDVPFQLTNITQLKNIQTNGEDPLTGRVVIHPDSLADVAAGDTLSFSYSYQQLALLPGKTRRYVCNLEEEIDSLQALDISIWDETGTVKMQFSDIADTANTVSMQGMTFDSKTNTVTLTIKNNYSQAVTISTLQFRGYPIKVISPIDVFVKNLPSIDEFGKKEVSIQNNYFNNIKLVQKVAQYIVDNNKQNRKRIEIEIPGYSEFSLDDVSKVTESGSGTNHKFTNERIDYSFTTDNGWTVKANLVELDSAPWVYESFKGESWQKTNPGAPDNDFLKDINANLIKNGGAELYTGFADREDIGAIEQKHIVPDYWQFTRASGNASSRIRDGGNLVIHGKHSFEITTTNSGTGYFEQIVNGIKPNDLYSLSLEVRLTSCSGKASVFQYSGSTLLQTDEITITTDGPHDLTITSLASTDTTVIRVEKLTGNSGSESFVFDKVKFENSEQATIYIENEETTAIQAGQRYANSLVIGNNYGIEVLDDQEQSRVRMGQYAPGKYGLIIDGGAIEIVGGLPDSQISSASSWSKNGTQIVLSNENQSITTDSAGKTKFSVVLITDIDTYKGTSRIAGTIGTLALKDSNGNVISQTGVTLSKANPTENASGSVTMTISSGTTLAAEAGYVEIPITVDGIGYTKKLTWSKVKDGYTPVKGTDYFDGQDGQDGSSSYLWVRYSQNSDGNPMTTDPTNAKYIGIATTTSSTAPSSYTSYSWSLVKGTDGVPGETGSDGKTSYLHIKYSNDGSTFTANNGETVGYWIGTYVDFTQADSNNFADYTWNKVKGEDGYTPVKGTDYFDGKDGQDGKSSYLWVRYSQNSSGNPMTTDPTNAKYIGTAVTLINTAPASYSSYSWSLIKGTDGLPGEPGSDGQTSYLHIKYSNDGGTTFTGNNGEDVGIYIGTYVDFTQADSNSVSAYTWNKVKGDNGSNGKVADILASTQTFKSTDNGVTYTPSSITLTPSLQVVTFSKWQYSTNGGTTFTDVVSGQHGLTIASNVLTVANNSDLFSSSVTTLTFKLVTNDAAVYDTLTVVRLYDVDMNNYPKKTDLRYTAPLPNSISLDANGITASTSDPTKYARLDYRGLYIKGGAIQIDNGLPDNQIANSGKWNKNGTYIDQDGIYTGKIDFQQGEGTSLKLGQGLTYGDGDLQVWADANGDGIKDIIGRIDWTGAYFPLLKADSIVGNVVNKWLAGNVVYYFDVDNGNDSNDGLSSTKTKKSLQSFLNNFPKDLNGATITIRARGSLTGDLEVIGFRNGQMQIVEIDDNNVLNTNRVICKYNDHVFLQNISIWGKGSGYSMIESYQNKLFYCFALRLYGGTNQSHGFWIEGGHFIIDATEVYNVSDRGLYACKAALGLVVNCKGNPSVGILSETGSIVNGAGTRWNGSLVPWTGSIINNNWSGTNNGTPPGGGSTPPTTNQNLSIAPVTGDNWSTSGYWENDSIKQGDWGYGTRYGIWYVDLSAVKGKTIDSATITVYRNSGGTNSGRNIHFRTHGYTSRGSRPGGAPAMSGEYVVGTIAVGETKTFDIKTMIQNNIANGIDKSIGIYTTGSTDYMSLGLTPTISITYH